MKTNPHLSWTIYKKKPGKRLLAIEDNNREAQEEEVIIEDDNKEQDKDIEAVEAAKDDTLDGEDPVQEETDGVFELQHGNIEDARSDDGDANNEVDDSNSIAEAPMATEEDKPQRTQYHLRPSWERTFCLHSAWTTLPAQKAAMTYSSYNKGASVMPSLREAVEVRMGSGSKMEVLSYVTGFIMTQMTAKAGIKQHRQFAIHALLYQAFLQMHNLGVFDRQHAGNLQRDKRGQHYKPSL
jgi:hypothetical protein